MTVVDVVLEAEPGRSADSPGRTTSLRHLRRARDCVLASEWLCFLAHTTYTMTNPADVRQGPKSESVQALKEVAAALLRQACQLLEQIIHGQDDGQRWGTARSAKGSALT